MQPLYEYVCHMKGHRNSKGELAEWVIKSHETGEILSSHKSEKNAKEHLQQMHIFNEAAESSGYPKLYHICGYMTGLTDDSLRSILTTGLHINDNGESNCIWFSTGNPFIKDVFKAPLIVSLECTPENIKKYRIDEFDVRNQSSTITVRENVPMEDLNIEQLMWGRIHKGEGTRIYPLTFTKNYADFEKWQRFDHNLQAIIYEDLFNMWAKDDIAKRGFNPDLNRLKEIMGDRLTITNFMEPKSDTLLGEASERKKEIPVIVCADMGMGKTTFVQKINDSGKYKCYDLEVCDLPNIWGEPDEDGNMALVDGWEDIALNKIKSLDADVVAITSDPKMVHKLIESGIPFFLAYKDDISAIRKDIEKRTSEHFANVVKDFWKYIEKSDIPEELKEQMKECDTEAMTNVKCADALPPSIIETDKFQSDDRYRHWHDMFKLKTGGKAVSIMDRNIENLESRLKEFDKITSNLCTKLRLNAGEYLSSPSILHKILDRVDEKETKSYKLIGESTYGTDMDKRVKIFMEGVSHLGLSANQVDAIGKITNACMESVMDETSEPRYVSYLFQGEDERNDIERMIDADGNIDNVVSEYGFLLDPSNPDNVTEGVPYILEGTDIIIGTSGPYTLAYNGKMAGSYLLYKKLDDDSSTTNACMEGVGDGVDTQDIDPNMNELDEYTDTPPETVDGTEEDEEHELTMDEMYDKLIEQGVSKQTINIVTDIIGWNPDSMLKILYAATGYRTFDQLSEF